MGFQALRACPIDRAVGRMCAALGLTNEGPGATAVPRSMAAMIVVVLAALLSGCAASEPASQTRWASNVAPSLQPRATDWGYEIAASPRVAQPRQSIQPTQRGGGYYKVGKPYSIAGRWYYPREEPGYDKVGLGSWYGDDFHGRQTANGEIFDRKALTAAHPTLPLPSYAYVTNLENGRTVLVRINDRGPYAPGRILDVSHEVARQLAFEKRGLARMRVRYAGRAPLSGDTTRERQHLAQQPWYRTDRRIGALETLDGQQMTLGALSR